MVRSKTPPYSLTRQLIRPSWNKYNLFNLSRKTIPSIHNKTMFQQKWAAKKETRSYHGEHLNERQLKTLFTPRFVGVASDNPRDFRTSPLASQAYAMLERRLDTAVFRALFASSTRQAKQIIVHGNVKVNGTQMKNAGYLLQPGDLFEVEPAAVIMNVSPPRAPQIRREEGEEEEAASATAEEETSQNGESSGDQSAETDAAPAATPLTRSMKAKKAWEEIGETRFVPKDYMSAFAFLPVYLEVSYETCSAVYLRDPVARPGNVEVPSHLPNSVHALAANWYQRGR